MKFISLLYFIILFGGFSSELFAQKFLYHEEAVLKKLDAEEVVPIAREYLKQFYPDISEVEWYDDVNPSTYFSFYASFKKDGFDYQVNICWGNWADGTMWNFHVEELRRHKSVHAITGTEKVHHLIKSHLHHQKYSAKDIKSADYFHWNSKTFETKQVTSHVDFKVGMESTSKLGVYVKRKVYEFDENGQPFRGSNKSKD